jgi:hypothetical protein
MPDFTALFGFGVHPLELVLRGSEARDAAGK